MSQAAGMAVQQGTRKLLFAYDEGGQLLGEYRLDGTPEQETVWLGNLPVATVRSGGAYAVHADHLGTPRVITDASNREVWRWVSDPFGVAVPEEDPDGDGVRVGYNLRFPGQYFDEETGLHYNYYRDYEPGVGRYVESDPIGMNGGSNPYAYVNSAPLIYIDLLGLKRVSIYKIETGVQILWYSKYLFGSGRTDVSSNYHPVKTILWTGEIDDKCVLKYIKTDSLAGPSQWGMAQVIIYESNSKEYVYGAPNGGCDSRCYPQDLMPEVTEHNFPFPGKLDLGSHPDNRRSTSPRYQYNGGSHKAPPN